MQNKSIVQRRQILEPKNLQEAKDFAEVLSKSGLVPGEYQGRPANILVAVQWGNEIGLAPMQALQNIAVINGRPSLWGDSLLALVMQHPMFGGCKEYMNEAKTEATCELTRLLPNGQPMVTVTTFSEADAKKANLWNKKGPWQQYPHRMMQLRARGFAVRNCFPDALKGMITYEEAQDMPDDAAMPYANKPGVELHPNLTKVQTTQELMDKLAEAEPGKDEVEDMPASEDPMFMLHIPGRDPEGFNFADDWINRYAELQLAMAGCSLPAAERRTKLKELEQANLDTLDELQKIDANSPHNAVDSDGNALIDVAAAAAELKEKRLKMNKHLSMQAKEEEAVDVSRTSDSTG